LDSRKKTVTLEIGWTKPNQEAEQGGQLPVTQVIKISSDTGYFQEKGIVKTLPTHIPFIIQSRKLSKQRTHIFPINAEKFKFRNLPLNGNLKELPCKLIIGVLKNHFMFFNKLRLNGKRTNFMRLEITAKNIAIPEEHISHLLYYPFDSS
jgi:hypothetical protein